MRTTSATRPDLAGHLRHTIVRVARRLRQEAGGELSPSLTAALSTVERHGPLTPSELAARERIQRPTATRVLARLEEEGLIERTAGPVRPPVEPRDGDRRPAARCSPSCARARRPSSPSGSRRSSPRSARRSSAPPTSWSGCSSGERRPRSHVRLPPAFRNYRRYFTGQVVSITGNWMQTVAEMWLVVQLTGSGVSVGLTAGAPVPADPAVRRLGRPARRPHVQAAAADDHAVADGAARAHAVGADHQRRRSRSGWSTRSCSRAAPSTPSTTRRARASRSRWSAPTASVNAVALNSVIVHTARILGPAAAGARDRAARRRPVLPGQRDLVRGDAGRAAGDGPARAAHAGGRGPRRAASCARRCATSPARRTCGSRWP